MLASKAAALLDGVCSDSPLTGVEGETATSS